MNTFSYPEITLSQLLEKTAQERGDAIAMSFMGHSFSYAQFDQMATMFASALLGEGFQHGDRLAIMLPNCPQYLIALFGAARAGVVVVQVTPMATPKEFHHFVTDSEAKGIVIFEPLLAKLQTELASFQLATCVVVNLQPLEPLVKSASIRNEIPFDLFLERGNLSFAMISKYPNDDVAVLQYTGGTTGLSKGAMLTHANLVANAYQNMLHMPPTFQGRPMTMLAVIPFFHVYALSVCAILGVATASHLLILPRFAVDELIGTVNAYQPDYFPAVPTMILALLLEFEKGVPTGWKVEFCNVGSAPMPQKALTRFEKLTGTLLLEGYGLSEASPVTHCNTVEARKPGTIGHALTGTEAKIMDTLDGKKELPDGEIGELVIRGPQVMKGYWKMPEETAHVLRDGWLFTGDLAVRDAEGFYSIVDRKKDLILAGGFNVYPREVEEVLYTHPSIQEAAVIGVPDAYRGENVKAFVVLKSGHSVTSEELDQFLRQTLSAYKVPHVYEFRASLPKTPVGKLLRRELLEEEKRKSFPI